jgi:polysaccharide biosynthesis protein PslH
MLAQDQGAVPRARLRLVGRYSDGPVKPVGQDIDGLGWVSEITEEISTWSAMVVPIHVGAGTRGKIALAFSQKCPVVSTTLGAYGYESRDREIVSLADSAEAFSDACYRTIREPAEAAAIAACAWRQFLEKWTRDAIRPSVWATAHNVFKRVRPARRGAEG